MLYPISHLPFVTQGLEPITDLYGLQKTSPGPLYGPLLPFAVLTLSPDLALTSAANHGWYAADVYWSHNCQTVYQKPHNAMEASYGTCYRKTCTSTSGPDELR